MLRVGLTGGLASGKSTVARMLQERGIPVLDADLVTHRLLKPGTEVYDKVLETFGSDILKGGAGSEIDRAKLAAKAFDPRNPRTTELNAIVHPAVIEAQEQWLDEREREEPHGIAIVEAALIFEAGAEKRFDRTVLVIAPQEIRARRYAERAAQQGGSLEDALAEARRRMGAQMTDDEKRRRADFVIENEGDLSALAARVTELEHELRHAAGSH